MIGDRVHGVSNEASASDIDGAGVISSSITERTFEGIGFLHSRYGLIIADYIKSVFSISTPKD